ncbi:MAG: hypothetical protein ACREBD_21715 [Blastocatellia bacterium]
MLAQIEKLMDKGDDRSADARLCKALLDRITDRATIIETGSESFRFRRTLVAKRKAPSSVARTVQPREQPLDHRVVEPERGGPDDEYRRRSRHTGL